VTGTPDAPERLRLARLVRQSPCPRPPGSSCGAARDRPQTKKPGEFIHGLDDVPPPLLTAFIGFQHVSLVRIQLIFPALVIQLAELPTEVSVNMLSLSLMALGVAAMRCRELALWVGGVDDRPR
jgi:hypothetical protein